MNSTVPKIGEMFSGCEILAHCGQGSFGSTYLARNPLGQHVIIKVITSQYYSERELAGLRNYMQVSGKHPSLLKIFHIGELDEGFYYIMEAADNCNSDGETYQPATLGNFLRQKKSFQIDEAIQITRDLLEGVRVIHEANLIHRDIKPDNVIFVNNQAKLSDPGLVTAVGQQVTFAGTLGFIPPEFLETEEPVNQQADLYAIGKIFYCMVTGCHPKEYPHLPLDMRRDVCRQIFPALSQMCNRNPDKRYKNVDEFLKGLPRQLKNPTRWEQRCEDFRAWRILNREKFRNIKIGLGLLIAVGIAALAAGIFYKVQQYKENLLSQTKVRQFKNINRDRQEVIALQLEAELPEKLAYFQTVQQQIKAAEGSGNWHAAAGLCGKLQDFLRKAAELIIPELPVKHSSPVEDFAAAGRMYSFLLSPLAEYLPAEEKQKLKKKLAEHEKGLYDGWRGPKIGNPWEDMQVFYMPMEFVHAGAVKLAHNSKIVKVPYHFWMSRHEIYSATYSHYTGVVPHIASQPTVPITKVAWNDILYFCKIMTQNARIYNKLPPGYIIRPPTEAEWRFAAANGYLGKDKSKFTDRNTCSANSNRQIAPAGLRLSNKLGLHEMYGNVREIVQPLEPTVSPDSVLLLGGGFRDNEKSALNLRIEYKKYQFIPDDIGFRVVMAPGDMSYFDREFFMYCSPERLEYNGKIYELFGANYGSYNWHISQQTCELLGGKLARINDVRHLKELKKAIPLFGAWYTFVGARVVDGKWRWVTDNKEVDFGSWHKNIDPATNTFLTVSGRKWRAVSEKEKSGIFLCEWDKKQFPQRNDQLAAGKKLPLEVMRFSCQGKTFILLKNQNLWYSVQRICQLLGGRIACLDSEELRREAVKQLAEYSKYRILLGGYAKYDKWFWLSGKEITEKLQTEKSFLVPSLNRNFVTLYNGKLYNSQYSALLLCELPDSVFSSRLR